MSNPVTVLTVLIELECKMSNHGCGKVYLLEDVDVRGPMNIGRQCHCGKMIDTVDLTKKIRELNTLGFLGE